MSGKTLAMVQSLPATGSIVLCSEGFNLYISDMIREVRGDEVIKQTRVISIVNSHSLYQCREQIKPIFYDPFMERALRRETMDEIKDFVFIHNARYLK